MKPRGLLKRLQSHVVMKWKSKMNKKRHKVKYSWNFGHIFHSIEDSATINFIEGFKRRAMVESFDSNECYQINHSPQSIFKNFWSSKMRSVNISILSIFNPIRSHHIKYIYQNSCISRVLNVASLHFSLASIFYAPSPRTLRNGVPQLHETCDLKTYRKITDTFRAKGIHVFTLNSIFIWHILFFNLYILN